MKPLGPTTASKPNFYYIVYDMIYFLKEQRSLYFRDQENKQWPKIFDVKEARVSLDSTLF